MASSIIALRDEDIVILSTLERLVEWDWWTHELLLNAAEALETGCKLEVVVGAGLGHGGHDGDVVALWTDVVGRGDHGDVNV